MRKNYFKIYSESLDGREGSCLYEVINGLVVKQLEIFGSDMFWASSDRQHNHPDYEFTDQPEWDYDEEYDGQEEILEEHFLELWQRARNCIY